MQREDRCPGGASHTAKVQVAWNAFRELVLVQGATLTYTLAMGLAAFGQQRSFITASIFKHTKDNEVA